MSFKDVKNLIYSDYKRFAYDKKGSYLKLLLIHPILPVLLIYRLKPYFVNEFQIPIIKQLTVKLLNLLFIVYKNLAGIELQWATVIGKGIYIPHSYGIVINSKCEIGDYCTIHQGVTIGRGGRGENEGVPKIGSYVYIGAGAVILGKIVVGNNSVIGANAVVTKDVPDNAVVVGIPAKIINYNGSSDFINISDNENLLIN